MTREDAAATLVAAAGGGSPREGDVLYFHQGGWVLVSLTELVKQILAEVDSE